jgi:hypothetical protein
MILIELKLKTAKNAKNAKGLFPGRFSAFGIDQYSSPVRRHYARILGVLGVLGGSSFRFEYII